MAGSFYLASDCEISGRMTWLSCDGTDWLRHSRKFQPLIRQTAARLRAVHNQPKRTSLPRAEQARNISPCKFHTSRTRYGGGRLTSAGNGFETERERDECPAIAITTNRKRDLAAACDQSAHLRAVSGSSPSLAAMVASRWRVLKPEVG